MGEEAGGKGWRYQTLDGRAKCAKIWENCTTDSSFQDGACGPAQPRGRMRVSGQQAQVQPLSLPASALPPAQDCRELVARNFHVGKKSLP